jgi:hypothetical protein
MSQSVRVDDDTIMKPMPFMFFVGTMLNLVVGFAIDSVIPAAKLLGFNMQGVVFFATCQAAALWIGLRFELLD